MAESDFVEVHIELRGATRRVGTLYSHSARGRESASFTYAQEWLDSPDHFALEPALRVTPGPHHTPHKLFGAVSDSAPDRWGRTLLRRREVRAAQRERRTPRTLRELDFLMGVTDEVRQGALRFSRGGPFLAEPRSDGIPPLVELPLLLRLAERFLEDEDMGDELEFLFAPGSSLGGARPKASVRATDGRPLIAKFPKPDDDYRVVAWECVALTLARRAGLSVEAFSLQDVKGRDVLLLERFDREDGRRIPYLSAMSMLGATDGDRGSYLEIADALRQHGTKVRQNLAELWRRIVFNVLISNTDDHMRNHAFLLREAAGWSLSPAFDLNPTPTDLKARFLSTAIDMDNDRASLELAFEVTDYFDLPMDEARRIAREVGEAVQEWRCVASAFGIAEAEIGRLASAFEHEDLALALS